MVHPLKRASLSNYWLVVWGYVLIIYLSLPFTPTLLSRLYRHFGKNGLEILFLGLSIFFLSGVYFFFKNSSLLATSLAIALSVIILSLASFFLKLPGERIHFIEYAILGILIRRACRLSVWPSWLALVFVFAVGVLDEFVQALLPNRVGELKDIWLNLAGGFWGIGLSWLKDH